ncbi:MAG: 3-hydroxyacyl-CoA dehydrogenase family protein [Acidobacteriota bacterium]|nr:3-hydroxyacyl-CoA dehydrogenase family protein [Acidobacteriota bacterium]MDH3785772.1 3-hydroxyacyl-CoA dehydrogenase family protein [Acidobacteriota bacterium]
MDQNRVVVIGAGTMGHGIAQVAASAGLQVALHDVSSDRIEAGLAAVERNLTKGVEKGKVQPQDRAQTLSRLTAAPDLSMAEGCGLVVEAVPEDIGLKNALFARLDEIIDADAILASNTSSLSIASIAEGTKHPQRVIGMHFFNPVHIMSLLEVVKTDRTTPDVLERTLDYGRRFGKEPIVVVDSPGFASSRLGLVLGLEAMRMFEQGVASAEDIDKAMTLGYRHPMGPLRLTDLVGLDVRLAIAEHLHRELGSEAFLPPQILRDYVDSGRLGKKSGRGFYDWP